MTWSYLISAVLLLSVIVEYRLKHIDTDRRTTAHKRTRWILLTIAIVSIVAQQIIAEVKDRRKFNSEAELRAKVDKANSNSAKLLVHQGELLTALGTNNAIDPKLRVEILEHSRAVELVSIDVSELETWKTDFKNEQAAAKQKEQAAKLGRDVSLTEQATAAQGRVDRTWKRATPMYDLIIQTLQASVRDIAKSRGEKLFSDYTGLPPAPVGNKSVHVATITTGTNLGWSFDVSACGIPRPGGYAEVMLYVQGSCSNQIEKTGYYTGYFTKFASSETPGNPGATNMEAESFLLLNPYNTAFVQAIHLEGYQTNILAWVRRFIGAHASRCDSR